MDTIWVTLTANDDPTKPPVFDFTPPELVIEHGVKTVVHWKKKQPATGLNFVFVALVFHEDNPFSSTVVDKAENEIRAQDNNTVKERHSYFILVEINGRIYSSEPSGMGTGGGTIRNN